MIWIPGSLIRNKVTGKPYFVVHIYEDICTLVFDITSKDMIVPMGILLPRDYDQFCVDEEMEEVKKDLLNDAIILKYKPIDINKK